MSSLSYIIDRYISFFEKRGHKRISNSPLVPENDPTTLFTSSGMQPLVPYLLAEPHPAGKRLVNVQNCFRAQDIDEVGDNRHTTFFRMLGNWSLGDYFKKEQLPWFFEFLTNKKEGLGLDPERLYVTIFDGDDEFRVIENNKWQPLRPDVESADVWTRIFEKVGIKAKIANISTREKLDINTKGRIFYYGAEKNWWSRSGTPEQMPIGEIGGPDSEVFYDFGAELKIHENSQYKDKECHPNCDCGRFLEIGNSVFMQYKKIGETTFEELPNKNVDFGGGLERLLAAVENQPDILKTSHFSALREKILTATKLTINETRKSRIRIFLDHSQAATFLISEGVLPGKKDRESVLRRLIRKANDQLSLLELDDRIWQEAVDHFTTINKSIYEKTFDNDRVIEVIKEELKKYEGVYSNANRRIVDVSIPTDEEISKVILEQNLKKYVGAIDVPIFMRRNSFTSLGSVAAGTVAFDAQSTLGFPLEETMSIAEQKLGDELNSDEAKRTFNILQERHQQISRKGVQKKFAGGLVDHSEKTIKGHTATHLLHQALRDVLGSQVHQAGSNITAERIRFDFAYDRKMTEEEIEKVEEIVNHKIKEDLPVHFEFMPVARAKKIGAIGLFDEKYGEKVKVYFIGGRLSTDKPYSIEFCGGPHVEETGKLKNFQIVKEESLGKTQRRIYAKIT